MQLDRQVVSSRRVCRVHIAQLTDIEVKVVISEPHAHWVVLISVLIALSNTSRLKIVHRVVCLFTSQPLGRYQIILLEQRYISVDNMLKVTMQRYPAET